VYIPLFLWKISFRLLSIVFFILLPESPYFASIQKNGAEPVHYILLLLKISGPKLEVIKTIPSRENDIDSSFFDLGSAEGLNHISTHKILKCLWIEVTSLKKELKVNTIKSLRTSRECCKSVSNLFKWPAKKRRSWCSSHDCDNLVVRNLYPERERGVGNAMPGGKAVARRSLWSLASLWPQSAVTQKTNIRGVCLCTLAYSHLFAYEQWLQGDRRVFQISAVCIMHRDPKYTKHVVIKVKKMTLSVSTPWMHRLGTGIAPRMLNLGTTWRC
jgi:hypothetical protein